MRTVWWVLGSMAAHALLVAALFVRWPAPASPEPPQSHEVEVVLEDQAAQAIGQLAATAERQLAPQDGEATPPPPAAPSPPAPPAVNLGIAESAPWHVVSRDIRPPAPDARWRNLPPRFPPEAAARGETGAVALLVHVADDGSAAGADIVETSGSVSLDREARRAVLLWHFEPARLDGHAVPFDYPIIISFTRDR